jgi:hypothetical protein
MICHRLGSKASHSHDEVKRSRDLNHALSIYAADIGHAKGERRISVDLNQSCDESWRENLSGPSEACEMTMR